MVKEHSVIISKFAISMMLLAVLELNKPTPTEISNHLGYKPSQTSRYLREMEECELISVKRETHMGDRRTNRVSLTVLGRAQAELTKASASLLPGEDKIAAKIIKVLKSIRGA